MNNEGMYSSTKKHDVFLSFRGEDIRTTFVSHLHNALKKAKPIRTFIDYDIPRGEDVWPTLVKAIEESNISIVIFSENYATSKWCLEELYKILQCRKDNGQVVMPVFYKTDPSDVRHQTGSYETAFAKHERESNKKTVRRWRTALTEAANMAGRTSGSHRDETQLIENIVNDVLQKLDLREPIEQKGILIEKNCRNVELLMKKHQKIGIWGMPGIGKTTIAKVMFAQLFPQYDNTCFVVANAKEFSLSKLLSELLKEENSTSNGLEYSLDMKMTRLACQKVFIVLDDVDNVDQIEYLCEEYCSLSSYSRLIVTTRDRQLLYNRVDHIYEVKEWDRTESLEFFCLKAFKQSKPQSGFRRLSKGALDYAGGVPLALKVLGSYLFHSRNTKFWKSTLRKLNDYPDEKIQGVLRVSYDDGLDALQKKIFRDIAFFFQGKEKDHVRSILDACGFEASSGLEVLKDKALITISNSNGIQMHNLLQIMGLKIVREEDENNPGKRSRLRDSEAREVIEKNKGTRKIEGITLDLSQNEGLRLPANTFTKMETLRFLKLYSPSGQRLSSNTYIDLPEVLEPFSDKLRYVEWTGYPFESLPSPFYAKLLVEIRMPHSNVKQLWQGTQELDNLERIDLSECKRFENLPDLSKASRLKWVNLSGCESLYQLHDSVLSADTLVTLSLDRCTRLKSVKGKKHLKSLETISVIGCSSLEEFAMSSELLENLDLSSTGIQRLDTSIGLLKNLKWLNLEGLKLGQLPKELSCLKSLWELKLSDRGLEINKQQLHDLFDGLQFLQILHLKECRCFFELPDNISILSKRLQELRLDGSNVTKLPESIKDLQELEILSLENCRALPCLPELPPHIKQLYAVDCTSLLSVSNLKTLTKKMLGKAKQISFKNSLRLDGRSLKCIVESVHLTVMCAAFHNVIVRNYREYVLTLNYNSVEVCLPGSRVPRQINNRTTESSITIELPNRSNLLGFIYYVVLSPARGMKKHGAKIKCECAMSEGTKVTWLKTDITELKSDHVYVWYDPFHCDSILNSNEPKVRFDFFVASDEWEVDGSICVKECGVHLISVSELPNVLPELDLDSDKEMDLRKGLEKETGHSITFTSIERPDELGPDSAVAEPDSTEEDNERKDHYSNLEDSIKSTSKENPTESTDAVKSEGNNGTLTLSQKKKKSRVNKLHVTAELQSDKENESKEKSITQPKSATVEVESIEEDSGSKGHFSDMEEIIGSTHKKTKTSAGRGLKENTTESTKFVKSKGNEVTPTESDAGLHMPVVSNNFDWTDYFGGSLASKALKLAKQATEDAQGKSGDKGKKDDKGKGVVPPKEKRVPTAEELAKRVSKGIVILDGKDRAPLASKDKTTTELEQPGGKRKGKEITTTSPKKTKVAASEQDMVLVDSGHAGRSSTSSRPIALVSALGLTEANLPSVSLPVMLNVEVPEDLSLIQVADRDIFGMIVQSIDVTIARLQAYRVATLASGQQYSGRGDQIAELTRDIDRLRKEVSTITTQKQLLENTYTSLEKVNDGHVSRIQELIKDKEELTIANKELTASLQRTEEALGTALSDKQEMKGKNLELKEALRDIFDDSFNNAVKQIILCNRSIDLELALINKNYIVKGNCLVEEHEGQPDEVIKDFGSPVRSGADGDELAGRP